MRLFHRTSYVGYVRNFIFGVEDSLVSTVGLLSGVAVTSTSRSTLLITGFVLISVEAVSMGVGSYLSEQSAADYSSRHARWTGPALSGLIMLISYLIAGFIPLSPYIFIPGQAALWLSISLSLISLFVLGIVSAKLLKGKVWTNALRVVLMGGIVILIGASVGNFLN